MLNRRILIVDDNEDIHFDFKKILLPKKEENDSQLSNLENQLFGSSDTKKSLLDWDYQIDSAHQGQQALQMVEEAAKKGVPYALVFMDIRMPPGWDGIETIKKIWEKYPYIEVVLCTAYTDYTSEDIISTLGISHRLLLLKKPFDAVAVKQMALATTSKWNFEDQARAHVENLEEVVKTRTLEISETVHKLTQLNQELDASFKKLSDTQALLIHSSKMSALGEMAGGVAHEVNNPLAIIHLFSSQLQEYIQDDPLNKQEIAKIASKIEETTIRISKIVNGLKSFSRDSSEDLLQKVSVKKVIDDTLGFCFEKFKNHGVDIKVVPVSDSVSIECRESQIGQVLLNLLNNSYDVLETHTEKWIDIGFQDQDDQIMISITDGGLGIPDEIRKKVFQPFFTTKPIGKGTGLGLSISKGIVEAHGGTLTVNEQVKNTQFVVRLPKSQASLKKV